MAQRDNVHIFSEFEDVERQTYIQMIIAKNPSLIEVSRGGLFCLWFGSKDTLRQLAAQSVMSNGDFISIHSSPDLVIDVVGRIAKGKTFELEQVELEQVNVAQRDARIAEEATIRDGERCVLTKHGKRTGVEVSHIVPFELHKTPRGMLWLLLDYFWGDEAQPWLQAIVGADDRFDTEKTSNMISLNSLVHTHWHHNHCALRVVRVADDEMSMDVAFHWLPLETGKRWDQVPLSQNPFGAGAQENYLKSTGDNFKVFNNDTEKLIESGSIFTIKTPDKEKYPLPSKELLDLMWALRRLAAMQGAEEYEEDDEEFEDDDEESDNDFPSVPSFSRSRSPVSPSPLRQAGSQSSSPLEQIGSLSLDDRHPGYLIEDSD